MYARQIKILVCSFSAGGALFGLCSQLHCGGGSQLPCRYEPTIVYGPPCSNPNVFHPISPRAINSAGQIAGHIGGCLGGGDTAMVWTAEEGIVTIPMPPMTTDSDAVDITEAPDMNELGQMCGTVSILDGTGPRGFIYDSGSVTLLDPLVGDPSSFGESVNLFGTVVGYSTGNQHLAVTWTGDRALQIPGLLGPDSEAADINDLGDITGWMGVGPAAPAGGSHAFLWEHGQVTELPIPEGALALDPRAISNNQQIVGRILYLDPVHIYLKRAFTWSDGVVTELPQPPGFESCIALDVNDSGVVCGECEDTDVFGHDAVIWVDGAVHQLAQMLPQDSSITGLGIAWAINNDGVIAASGGVIIDDTSHSVMVLLTPVYPTIGDLNCDEVVNALDLSTLLAQWGFGENEPADFNGDGFVGPADLAQLLAQWSPS